MKEKWISGTAEGYKNPVSKSQYAMTANSEVFGNRHHRNSVEFGRGKNPNTPLVDLLSDKEILDRLNNILKEINETIAAASVLNPSDIEILEAHLSSTYSDFLREDIEYLKAVNRIPEGFDIESALRDLDKFEVFLKTIGKQSSNSVN